MSAASGCAPPTPRWPRSKRCRGRGRKGHEGVRIPDHAISLVRSGLRQVRLTLAGKAESCQAERHPESRARRDVEGAGIAPQPARVGRRTWQGTRVRHKGIPAAALTGGTERLGPATQRALGEPRAAGRRTILLVEGSADPGLRPRPYILTGELVGMPWTSTLSRSTKRRRNGMPDWPGDPLYGAPARRGHGEAW